MAKDFDSAIGDYTRLTHLLPASTSLLLRLAHLNYYITGQTAHAMTALKQCLHHDPDNKECRTAHRLSKAQIKELEKLEKFDQAANPKGVLRLLMGYQDTIGLIAKFDEELAKATVHMALPAGVDSTKISEPRKMLYRAACKAYSRDGQHAKGTTVCEVVLSMDPNDPDALMSKGDMALAKEEWEDAVRAYEKAFEASGRASQEVRRFLP